MADGVTAASGANSTVPNGTKFATDDTGATGHVPLVKLAQSTDGSATPVTADADGLKVQGSTTLSGVSASSATVTSVSDTSSSTQLLAANSARVGWAVTNTSSAVLYVKLGSTASSTSFTKRLAQFADCGQGPLDGLYTGAIHGIWATDPNDGAAIVTEW